MIRKRTTLNIILQKNGEEFCTFLAVSAYLTSLSTSSIMRPRSWRYLLKSLTYHFGFCFVPFITTEVDIVEEEKNKKRKQTNFFY